jgi:hypothetical protein
MAFHPAPLVVSQDFYDQFTVLGPRMRRVTIPISNVTSTRQDLPYVDANTVSVEEFIETYDRGNKPCIIRVSLLFFCAICCVFVNSPNVKERNDQLAHVNQLDSREIDCSIS